MLRELYTKYELKSALASLDRENVVTSEQDTGLTIIAGDMERVHSKPSEKKEAAVNYETILELPVLEEWIAKLSSQGYFSFDTETTGLDYLEAELVGVFQIAVN